MLDAYYENESERMAKNVEFSYSHYICLSVPAP